MTLLGVLSLLPCKELVLLLLWGSFLVARSIGSVVGRRRLDVEGML